MAVDVRGIPIGELDRYGVAYGERVARALDDTLALAFESSPDALTAAGWRGAFDRLRGRATPSDVSSFPSLWRESVQRLSSGVRDIFGVSATRTREDSIPAVSPPPEWTERVTSGPEQRTPQAAEDLWVELIRGDMPLVPQEAADPVTTDTVADLNAVGDRMWKDLTDLLAAAEADALTDTEIAELIAEVLDISQARARAVARTEVARAANAASLAQMRLSGLTGIKIWQTVGDAKVRPAHEETDTQERNVADTFSVGGFPMQYPGDPGAPPELRINCRCDMGFRLPPTQTPAWAVDVARGPMSPNAAPEWPMIEGEDETEEIMVTASTGSDGDAAFQSRMPPQLKNYWLNGEGAALIGWGTPGSFTRCVAALSDDFPQETPGLCANLYHEATGRWPGEAKGSTVTEHTGGMIALIPHAGDAARFTLDGGEPLEDMHVTLAYLGEDVTGVPAETRAAIVYAARGAAERFGPMTLDAFSVNVFNPGDVNDRTPCVVMGMSGEGLSDLHSYVGGIVSDHIGETGAHPTFVPHMTLYYANDGDTGALVERVSSAFGMVGPVGFDRLRVAFADDVIDIPLAPDEVDDADDVIEDLIEIDDADDDCPDPDDMGEWEWTRQLVVEGIKSGDGRLFLPGSLVTETPPLPFAYQQSTAPGHDNAVAVGRIDEIWRDGDVIMGRGVIGLDTPTGRRAALGMCRGYQRGISIDADMVTGESFEDDYGVPSEVYDRGRIRGATLVMTPAYTDGETMNIPIRDDVPTPPDLVACACDARPNDHVITIPDVPPAEWFAEPTDVEMHGALTVTDRGRVFGLLAPDGVMHRSFRDRSVTAPRGVDYADFLGAETIVAGGGRVVTGPITMGCGHASVAPGVDASAALEHYDNTCSVVANVTVGENAHGVWVAGALVPGATADQVVRMMGCRLSGDWRPSRNRSGVRELTAALLVPTPGFASPRTRASVTVEDGAMVASSVPVEFSITPQAPPAPKDPLRIVADSLMRSMGRDVGSRIKALGDIVHGRS